MARWLNRTSLLTVMLFTSATFLAQVDYVVAKDDYKNRKQFEKFSKRRTTIGAWQINQLKAGALVVRLKTEKLVIEGLKSQDKPEMAEKIRLETAAKNLNVIRAFRSKYSFSKVYFIYSHSSEDLLNGTRDNIFVDTTLEVNPSIRMAEKFYLIAESDVAYNSSIGFVPEDSAKKVTERGSATSDDFPIVVKNKYGHQLKKPFPYLTSKRRLTPAPYTVVICIQGACLPFNINTTPTEKPALYIYNGKPLQLVIPKMYTYEIFCDFVDQLNDNLRQFYQANPTPQESSVNYRDAAPFLY